MKQFVAAILGLVFAAGMAVADPLEGQWRTAPDDNGNTGLIDVKVCGTSLCGTLVKAFDGAGAEMESANIGRQIIFETVPHGNGRYSGKVWSPDRDKTYSSKLVLAGNTLAVSGCVLGICRNGGTWTKE